MILRRVFTSAAQIWDNRHKSNCGFDASYAYELTFSAVRNLLNH